MGLAQFAPPSLSRRLCGHCDPSTRPTIPYLSPPAPPAAGETPPPDEPSLLSADAWAAKRTCQLSVRAGEPSSGRRRRAGRNPRGRGSLLFLLRLPALRLGPPPAAGTSRGASACCVRLLRPSAEAPGSVYCQCYHTTTIPT